MRDIPLLTAIGIILLIAGGVLVMFAYNPLFLDDKLVSILGAGLCFIAGAGMIANGIK